MMKCLRHIALCFGLLIALGVSGCGKDTPARDPDPAESPNRPASPEQPATTPPATAGSARTEQAPQPKPSSAKGLAESLVTHLRRVRALDLSLEDDAHKTLELEAAKLKRFRKLVLAAYAERDYLPYASRGDALSEEGRQAIALILDVGSHALKTRPYPIEGLKVALADYEDAAQRLTTARNKAAEGSAALAKMVLVLKRTTRNEDEPYTDFKARLEAALLGQGLVDGPDSDAWMGELRKWSGEVHRARKSVHRALARLDVLLLQGFFQYALDFRHLKVAHPFEGLSPADRLKAPQTYRKRLVADLKASGGKLGSTMRSWWPAHPYYEKARRALKRYRQYVADESVPGWDVRGTVKRGHKGKKVLALKKRLAAEGYFAGPLDDPKFGDALEEAVKRYQRHHQLKPDGIVRNSFGLAKLTRTSLAVPMSARARQIALSLQRWRESKTHREPFYFRVNVPQFEVEVWDGDELARKHRIIVGNNRFEKDPDHGRQGHLNRTALISNEISKVVINPVWHVPERIKVSEILVEAQKDPEYLKKNGYLVKTLASGRQIISQGAGPGNALGRVKLLFPNQHSIYMHDTPKKRLFKRTIRTFSHGCMRLQDPIDMATFLLERQGIMTKREVERTLATKKERGVLLEEKVPIHIEYNTIAFEPDSDDPIFLNDTYKYDRAYHEGKIPLQPHEKIPVVKTESPTLVFDEEGRLIVPEDAIEEGDTPERDPTSDTAPIDQPSTDTPAADDAAPSPTAPTELNEPNPED